MSDDPRDIPEPDDFDDYYYRNCDFEPDDPPGASEKAAGVKPAEKPRGNDAHQ